MDSDSINVFKMYEILELKDSNKIGSVDHVNKRLFVVGDKNGSVTLYQIGIDRKSSQPVKDPIRVSKSYITKVACLSQNHLLVVCQDESNLYVVDFAKNQFEVVLKGAETYFSYWQGEQGKPKLFALSKSKGYAYNVDFDAQSLQKVLLLEKVISHYGRKCLILELLMWGYGTRISCAWGFQGKSTTRTTSTRASQ